MKRVTKAPVTNQRRNWWEVQVDWIHRDWIEEMKPSPSELNPFELTGFTWIESIKRVKNLKNSFWLTGFIWIGSIIEFESRWILENVFKLTGFTWIESIKQVKILLKLEECVRVDWIHLDWIHKRIRIKFKLTGFIGIGSIKRVGILKNPWPIQVHRIHLKSIKETNPIFRKNP